MMADEAAALNIKNPRIVTSGSGIKFEEEIGGVMVFFICETRTLLLSSRKGSRAFEVLWTWKRTTNVVKWIR